MSKEKIIALLKEKITNAKFNTEGIAVIPVSEIGDANVITEVIEDLKADCTVDFDFDLEKMTLKVYNPEDDIIGFEKRHPTPHKCVEKL